MARSKCPYCAEPLPSSKASSCPACGEALDAEDRGGAASEQPQGSKAPLIVGIVVAVFVGIVFVLGVLAALMMPALTKAKEKANRTKCSNNLRQLGLASIQYADDKRFYPHVRGREELDGDVATGDSPKIARAMFYYSYHDAPEGLICPTSMDMAAPTPPGMDMRTWFWSGATIRDAGVSPFVDGQQDPPLDQLSELSYGWSRRYQNANARSTTILTADRAAGVPDGTPLGGNHAEGWNVGQVDGTVMWVQVTGNDAYLTGTTDRSRDGFLCIKPAP